MALASSVQPLLADGRSRGGRRTSPNTPVASGFSRTSRVQSMMAMAVESTARRPPFARREVWRRSALYRGRVDYQLFVNVFRSRIQRPGLSARHGSRVAKSTRNHRSATLPASRRSGALIVGRRSALSTAYVYHRRDSVLNDFMFRVFVCSCFRGVAGLGPWLAEGRQP